MEDADAAYVLAVRPGDVLVGGGNFGCGSSREHAPLAIKGTGVAAVIAESFARIFFRNAINIGLPILECPAAIAGISAGDRVEVDLAGGCIINLTRGETFQALPYPDSLLRIIAAGGLIPATRGKTPCKRPVGTCMILIPRKVPVDVHDSQRLAGRSRHARRHR